MSDGWIEWVADRVVARWNVYVLTVERLGEARFHWEVRIEDNDEFVAMGPGESEQQARGYAWTEARAHRDWHAEGRPYPPQVPGSARDWKPRKESE
jgi:hypothetical protein